MSILKKCINRMFGIAEEIFVVVAYDGETDKIRETSVFSDYVLADAERARLTYIYPSGVVTLASRTVQQREPSVRIVTHAHAAGVGRTWSLRVGDRGGARISIEVAPTSRFGASATADWTDTEELRAAIFAGPVIVGVGLRGAVAAHIARAIGRPIDNTGSAASTLRFN